MPRRSDVRVQLLSVRTQTSSAMQLGDARRAHDARAGQLPAAGARVLRRRAGALALIAVGAGHVLERLLFHQEPAHVRYYIQ